MATSLGTDAVVVKRVHCTQNIRKIHIFFVESSALSGAVITLRTQGSSLNVLMSNII